MSIHLITIAVFAYIAALVIGAPIPNPRQQPGTTHDASDLRTGDILLYRTAQRRSILDSLVSPQFSHVGIVFLHGGKPFVLEAHAEEKERPGGVFAYPVEQRVRAYDGEVWASLSPDRRINHWPLSGNIPRYLQLDYDDQYRWTIFRWSRRPGDRRVFCSELVTMALQDLQIGRALQWNPVRTTPDNLLQMYGGEVGRVVTAQ